MNRLLEYIFEHLLCARPYARCWGVRGEYEAETERLKATAASGFDEESRSSWPQTVVVKAWGLSLAAEASPPSVMLLDSGNLFWSLGAQGCRSEVHFHSTGTPLKGQSRACSLQESWFYSWFMPFLLESQALKPLC